MRVNRSCELYSNEKRTAVEWRAFGRLRFVGSYFRPRRYLMALLLLGTILLAGCGRNRQAATATPAPTLRPTFTATTAVHGAISGTTTATPAQVQTVAPVRSPTATPQPTATPAVMDQLSLAQYQYRIGDYAAARTNLAALLRRPEATDAMRESAHYYLARTYLAESAYSEANNALAPLLALPDGKEVTVAATLPLAVTAALVTRELAITEAVTVAITSSAELSTTVPLRGSVAATATTMLTPTDESASALALPHGIDVEPAQLVAMLGVRGAFAAKADFLQAEALVNLGQHSQAIVAYWRFLEAYPMMAGFVQPRIGAAYLALGDRESAAVAYRRAADAAVDRVAKARLLEALADLYSSKGEYLTAVTTYDEILALAQNEAYRAEIQFRTGQALATAGDLPGAIARWRAATEEAPASGSAYLALVELVNRNVAFDLFQRGYIDLQASALQPAISAFQSYIDSVSATDSRIGAAWEGMGQAYFQAESYGAALDAFAQVIANYPTCDCFGRAWLGKAATEAAQGELVAARRTYRTFARDHASDPLAPEALWRSALISLNEDNRIEAAADLLRLADAFPASERSPFALYLVGFGAFRAGLYEQSIALFQRLQKDHPDYNVDGVAFWLGRAHQAAGATAAANAAWQAIIDETPDTYYGILAAQAARGLPLVSGNFLNAMSTIVGSPTTLADDDGSKAFAEGWLAAWLQKAPAVIASIPLTVANDPDLQIGALLLEVDARGEGLAALGRVYERNKDNPHGLYALSLLYEEIGAYRLSIIAMSRLLVLSPADLVENAPLFLQQRVYPRHFADLIVAEALTYRLNPWLYFSLIRQESLFEEGARSSAAAQGLAQIIPDTGHWVAERLGHPDYTNEVIYRPHVNLQFGAYYLAWVRDYLEGNIISALVGYNAGPGNAVAWRELAGADDTLFVELLSVNEPRTYVRSITTNLYHYTRLYGSLE